MTKVGAAGHGAEHHPHHEATGRTVKYDKGKFPAFTSRPAGTARTIKGLLNGLERGTRQNDQEIASVLESEKGKQLDQTLAQLGPAGLKQLDQQINPPITDGNDLGLSADERRDLFVHFAEDSNPGNGKQLAQVLDALGPADQQVLAQAIATHSTTQTKLDFIDALKSQTTAGTSQALAAATVLGSLQGGALNTALGSLNRQQLGAIIGSSSFDTKALTNIINHTAALQDPQVKARVFTLAAQDLPHITSSADRQKVTDALSGLMNSDTVGIMNALLTPSDPEHWSQSDSAQAITDWTGGLIDEGGKGGQEISQVITRLRTGGRDGTTAYNYLVGSHPNSDTSAAPNSPFHHQLVLGFFVGAANAAFTQAIKNEGDNNNTIKEAATAAFGAIGGLTRGAAVGASLANFGFDQWRDALQNSFDTSATNAQNRNTNQAEGPASNQEVDEGFSYGAFRNGYDIGAQNPA